ncbi:bifunctional 2-C-methyl-D-erythritol 4-phosphate cytidylyltransferase/2-C-methyl-D-erythritol 2,4-cyclodiphosphate synthase [Deferrisoma camini]|uniref:bifunctional 2-C-methyl-D-erythritol 4-phosphate cytidylyltransferase/2-C-methyl-D-erythritol 2,4-cyclodiphosphate synthase n=1 Tax=Deferrisoma camini TaxID=1035120 RepID=UPI0004AE3E3C|nr:bifunctional 2-C-methyl-D-erythritol 4-phosphate cytidylyltransferase/2-C-methyl-D-erythritol 2,4-cyclodiphosphate synthase [Deferrisoma camini]
MSAWGVVAAGGSGRRMGSGVPKQFLALAGAPVLVHTLRALGRWPGFAGLCVAAPADSLDRARDLVDEAHLSVPVRVVAGGAERAESVLAGVRGLEAMGARPGDVVLVHDAARPFPPVERFDELASAASPDGALLAVPMGDTVKRADGSGRVAATVDRDGLWRAQTPQAFPLGLLVEALARAVERGLPPTDEAGAVEALGRRPRIVVGDRRNLKITVPEDLEMAQALATKGAAPLGIGHGYDVHRLVEGRPLVLGGVTIPFDKGLLGHSDADVLAHAVGDAVLGACGLGDLGRHFPDTDPRWKGASSLELLSRIAQMASARGYVVQRVDATLVAQRPKVAGYVAEMEATLSRALGLAEGGVTVKATTTEGLGFEGRGEGISAHAVALVGKRPEG